MLLDRGELARKAKGSRLPKAVREVPNRKETVEILLRSLVIWGAVGVVSSWTSAADRPSAAARVQANQILEATGVKGGLVVLLGCGDGRLAAGLQAGEGFLVQALDADAASVEAARRHHHSRGLYGAVTAARFDGRRLP